MTMLLYKAMWQASVGLLGVQELVVAIHPDAESMYTSPLRFVRLAADVRKYPGLNASALALGLRLDLEAAPALHRQTFARVAKGRFNPAAFLLEAVHPQLQLPESKRQLRAVEAAQRGAALRLASLRPELLVGLSQVEFEELQRALGGAELSGSATPGSADEGSGSPPGVARNAGQAAVRSPIEIP